MGVIVEAPDDEVLLANEALLGLIGCVLLERGSLILVVVERRLVGDDEVPPAFAACFSTLNVAIPVVAMPVTWASGLPALNVSTVSVRHDALVRKSLTKARDDFLGRHERPCLRIAYRDRVDGHSREKRSCQPGAGLHPRLLGNHTANREERLVRARFAAIEHVMARLPTREARRQRQRPHPSIWPSLRARPPCRQVQQRRTDPQVRANRSQPTADLQPLAQVGREGQREWSREW